MKKTCRPILSLLILLVFSFGLFTVAGAESAVDTILATGTTQAFSAEEVPDEDIQTILKAGVSTASTINQQPWFFVAITDRSLMQELAGSGMGSGGRPGATAPEGMTLPEGMTPPESGMPEGGDPPSMPAGPSGSSAGAKASLGSSPLAIIVYMNTASKSPSPEYDFGLATQNMAIAASSLGYGVKIVSSPAMSLNGENHDQICEKLGISKDLKAVAVLLVGRPEESADTVSSASVRDTPDAKSVIIH